MSSYLSLAQKISRHFGCFQLDLRAVAPWRRLLGIILAIDLIFRFDDLEAHYTDQGVLPRAFFVDHQGSAALWLKTFRISGEYLWSILFVHGSKEWALGAFACCLFGACLLILGRASRLASLIAWIFLTSIQARNPLLNSGGDTLLRLMLFWSMLLPHCGARGECGAAWHQIATWGLFFQIAVVYAVTAWLKFGDAWVFQGYAISDALRIPAFARPSADWLLNHPTILPFLTRLTWLMEAGIPFLILAGAVVPCARLLAFSFILGLHLGIGCFLNVGLFQPIAVIAAIPLLPKSFWDNWEATGPLAHVKGPPRNVDLQRSESPGGWWSYFGMPSRLKRPAIILPLALPTAALVLVMTRQIDALFPRKNWIPKSLMTAGDILRLDQYWGMFAPSPPRSEQGTFYFAGDLPQDPGMSIDPRGLATEPLSQAFRSERWRKLYLNLSHDPFKPLRPALRGYLYKDGRSGHMIFSRREGNVVCLTCDGDR